MDHYPREFLDVNFLISTLYSFLHSKSGSKKMLPDVNYKNITLDDFKLMLKSEQQIELLNSIFVDDIKYLYDQKNKHILKRCDGVLSTDITLVPYADDRMCMDSHENADSLIAWILSDLVIKGVTNGILLNILTVDIRLSQLKPFIKKFNKMKSLLNKADDTQIKCTISEHFYKKQLLSMFSPTPEQMEIIIFQIMVILVKIQSIYPNFRHNTLTPNSVAIYLKKPQEITVTLNEHTHTYNDIGIEVKLMNFSQSIISGITDNNSLLPENKSISSDFDILSFLEAITSNDIYNAETLINKIKKFSMINVIMTEYFTLGDDINTMDGGGSKKKKKSRAAKGSRQLAHVNVSSSYGSSSSGVPNYDPDSIDNMDDVSPYSSPSESRSGKGSMMPSMYPGSYSNAGYSSGNMGSSSMAQSGMPYNMGQGPMGPQSMGSYPQSMGSYPQSMGHMGSQSTMASAMSNFGMQQPGNTQAANLLQMAERSGYAAPQSMMNPDMNMMDMMSGGRDPDLMPDDDDDDSKNDDDMDGGFLELTEVEPRTNNNFTDMDGGFLELTESDDTGNKTDKQSDFFFHR